MATNRAGNRSRGKARDGRAGNRAAAATHGNAAARVGNPISAADTPGGKARGGAGNAGDGGRGGGHAPNLRARRPHRKMTNKTKRWLTT